MLKHITPEEAKGYRKLIPEVDLSEHMRMATAYTREPDPEGSKFDIVTYYGDIRGGLVDETSGDFTNPHYVYILTNPSIPGIVKIGFTERTVLDRLKEINSAPGVVIPWNVAWSYKCPNGRSLESEIHSYLEHKGLHPNVKREGFSISVTDAIKIIEELGQKYQKPL